MELFEKLDLNDEVIRDFGYNEKNELSIITEEYKEAVKYCSKNVPEVKNIYFFDSHFKCDCCGVIKDIDEMIISPEDNNTYCNYCFKRLYS